MTEDTIVRTSRLPCGQEWAWHPDLNIVELSDRLDAPGRMRALEEMSRHWWKKCLRVVPDVADTA